MPKRPKKKLAKRTQKPEPQKLERCPTCGKPVYSIFDHVDKDCKA